MPESAFADTGNQYDALPNEMEVARANTLKRGMLPFSKHVVRLVFLIIIVVVVVIVCCVECNCNNRCD
jgi:t-SNARE complex subunit (syntaxin)